MADSSEMQFASAEAIAGHILNGVATSGEPFLRKALADAIEWHLPCEPADADWDSIRTMVVDPTDSHGFWTFRENASAEDPVGPLDRPDPGRPGAGAVPRAGPQPARDGRRQGRLRKSRRESLPGDHW